LRIFDTVNPRLPQAGFVKVRARYGFMDLPDAMEVLEAMQRDGVTLDPMDTSFFLSGERIIPAHGDRGMALWRERLFAAMARNAGNITDYFKIPPNRVVELDKDRVVNAVLTA
jgi:KUP system potassium uptake protein